MITVMSIYIGGVLTLLMAILHCCFYSMFGWADTFSKISPLNARILYTIHLALLLLFFMLGAISIACANELSRAEGLSFAFNGTLSLFWLWRLVWQLVYFKRNLGQRIPPIAIFLIIVFFLLFVSYSVPIVYRLIK